jgi:hypothetical protein
MTSIRKNASSETFAQPRWLRCRLPEWAAHRRQSTLGRHLADVSAPASKRLGGEKQ